MVMYIDNVIFYSVVCWDMMRSLQTSSQNETTLIGRLHMTSHISRQKNWLTKSCNLCWRGIGRTPIFGVILKTNVAQRQASG